MPPRADDEQFLKTKFGPLQQLTVLGWDGVSRRDAEDLKSSRMYTVYCSECAKDTELYGDGTFKTTKQGLLNAHLPCGCGQAKNTPEQTALKIDREADKRGFTFHGYSEGWKNNVTKTKLSLECHKCGHKWDKCSVASFLAGGGCPRCQALANGARVKKTDEEMVASLRKSGKFPTNKFWRAPDRNGKQNFFYSDCPVCSADEFVEAGVCSGVFESHSSEIQGGHKPCRCSNQYQWTQEQQEYRVSKIFEGSKYKFIGWKDGYKLSTSKMLVDCPDHDVWESSMNMLHGGSRCPACADYGFNTGKDGYLYILQVKGENTQFTGYGISNIPAIRLRGHRFNFKQLSLEIVEETLVKTTGYVAKEVEKMLKQNFPVTRQEIEGFKTEATYYEDYHNVVKFVNEFVEVPSGG